MVDTVVVRFDGDFSDNQKSKMCHLVGESPDERYMDRYHQKLSMPNGTVIQIRFFPNKTKYPSSAMTTQVNLTKALYGDNIHMITTKDQLLEACELVNGFFAQNPWLPDISLQNGKLYRIDLAYNHNVSHNVSNYLNILRDRHYPDHKTISYSGEGVEYRSKIHRPIFYNKELESGLQLPEGILRQETSLRRGYHIARLMGKEDPTLGDVNFEWVRETLMKDLRILSLDQTIYCDPRAYESMLIEKYGFTKGMNIYQHWVCLSTHSREQLLSFGMTEKTYQNWVNEIKDAHLPALCPDLKYPLPPLVIDF